MTQRVSKADVINIMQLAYPLGYGPRAVGQLVGRSYKTIQHYATELGLAVGRGRRAKPQEPTQDLLHALALARKRAGL